MTLFTQVTHNYLTIFSSYVHQFLQWGQWLFYTLLVIQITWMTLWYAFDHHSFSESMSGFIKRFFYISLFYTIMINPSWIADVVKTMLFMGHSLTHLALDPSSLIEQGIGIGNKIIFSFGKTNLLDVNFGMILILIVYFVVIFSFISIAIDMALTLIVVTALISLATFMLSFAALATTSSIAKQTLDIIFANCVKLLGLYLVVASSSYTLQPLVANIPETVTNLDPYVWIIAITLLFRQLAKYLPQQLVKIVSGIIVTEARETEVISLNYPASPIPLKDDFRGATEPKIVSNSYSEAVLLNTSHSNNVNSKMNETSTPPISDKFKQLAEKMPRT